MENIAHSLLGAAMARAGLATRCGRGTTITLIVASNLPDVDALINRALGVELGFLVRRSYTHSVFALPVVALFGALALRLLYREMRFRTLYGLVLLGVVGHSFFDLLNSYGVCVFYPISDLRPELALVFIVDIAFWVTLASPLLLSLLPPLARWRDRLGQAALVLLGLYIGLCALGRFGSGRVLDRINRERGGGAEFSYVFPEPLGPRRWKGVLREGDEYTLYLIHMPSGRWEERGRYVTQAEHPTVQAMRRSETARRLEWFYKAPVWRLRESAGAGGGSPTSPTVPETVVSEADVFDIRFQSLVLDWRRVPFGFRFGLRADGSVVEPTGRMRMMDLDTSSGGGPGTDD